MIENLRFLTLIFLKMQTRYFAQQITGHALYTSKEDSVFTFGGKIQHQQAASANHCQLWPISKHQTYLCDDALFVFHFSICQVNHVNYLFGGVKTKNKQQSVSNAMYASMWFVIFTIFFLQIFNRFQCKAMHHVQDLHMLQQQTAVVCLYLVDTMTMGRC